MNIKKRCFDFATAFMSRMDMPDLPTVLTELARVLRPTGFCSYPSSIRGACCGHGGVAPTVGLPVGTLGDESQAGLDPVVWVWKVLTYSHLNTLGVALRRDGAGWLGPSLPVAIVLAADRLAGDGW